LERFAACNLKDFINLIEKGWMRAARRNESAPYSGGGIRSGLSLNVPKC
jgi:hypothetical protein